MVRRCAELAELLAACQSGLARAAVVAEGTEELTASLVDRLAAVGVSVVALCDDSAEVARLRSIGVVTAPSDVDSATLASNIFDSVGQFSEQGSRRAGSGIPDMRTPRRNSGSPMLRKQQNGCLQGPARSLRSGDPLERRAERLWPSTSLQNSRPKASP